MQHRDKGSNRRYILLVVEEGPVQRETAANSNAQRCASMLDPNTINALASWRAKESSKLAAWSSGHVSEQNAIATSNIVP